MWAQGRIATQCSEKGQDVSGKMENMMVDVLTLGGNGKRCMQIRIDLGVGSKIAGPRGAGKALTI